MSDAIDIVGDVFGRLTVISRATNNKYGRTRWNCKCECGNEVVVLGQSLKSGRTISCGCYRKELCCDLNRTHGTLNDRLYRIWRGIRSRCRNPNATEYCHYGGKGISVCDEWEDFSIFYNWAITNGYNDTLTIDRLDSDGDYSPENCQWITRGENTTKRNLDYWNKKRGLL